jgi:hypothetical protein
VKTKAGNRDLPIPPLAHTALLMRRQQQAADKEAFGRAWTDTGLVFTTRSGLPVDRGHPGDRLTARRCRWCLGVGPLAVIDISQTQKATAFEDYVESVAYINVDVDNPTRVRIYPMTMTEALQLEDEQN